MLKKLIKGRFAALYTLIGLYLIFAFIVRISFTLFSFGEMDTSLFSILKIFAVGFIFDFGVAVFFSIIYAIYLTLMPTKFIGSWVDKIITYFTLFLLLFIVYFSFLGEFPFWEEFSTRYNFIAVDYLIYTYEVIENINQSYSLPLLILVLLLLCVGTIFLFFKFKILQRTFNSNTAFSQRLLQLFFLGILATVYVFFTKNNMAETSNNTYNNELSKNGVYSFFAAYRSNEMDYNLFYPNVKSKNAFAIIREELLQKNQKFISENTESLLRNVKTDSTESKPNIVLICIESFSADFMETFGNDQNITLGIDSLAKQSILFSNMYATGTRTIRGMEAITLSVPPTPGNSIVRRPNNDKLYSIASVVKQKGYYLNFYYGGDGYFDNMNSFFGGQGFNIIDRNRGNPLSDEITTKRTNIEDAEVTFENAWGVCDEDIYNKLIKNLDKRESSDEPTFNFVMTTSNHKPYSFPENKIDLPQGTRESAVKYTDYALTNFIKTAKTKSWFKNTVFVVIADHCASSAGRWEITIDKHHIPAFIYNLKDNNPQNVNKLASQIDIMPTLFGYLNWNYKTALYGKDISILKEDEERALIGNYRTVGLLKNGIFTQLNDRKKIKQFDWDAEAKNLKERKTSDKTLEELTISYYQTASERFKNGTMKEK